MLTEVLNDQFSSEFSAEDPGVVPMPEVITKAGTRVWLAPTSC